MIRQAITLVRRNGRLLLVVACAAIGAEIEHQLGRTALLGDGADSPVTMGLVGGGLGALVGVLAATLFRRRA